jgi:hypothetical protein
MACLSFLLWFERFKLWQCCDVPHEDAENRSVCFERWSLLYRLLKIEMRISLGRFLNGDGDFVIMDALEICANAFRLDGDIV